VWRLYATDDATGAFGFVTNRFRLEMTTRPRAEVAFAESKVRLLEGQSRELTLRRTGADLMAGSVTVTTTPGSAGSPSDFTPVATTVEFAAGETERTVRIDARRDRDTEPSETYGVVIGAPTGDAAVGIRESVKVTIEALRCAGRLATIVGTPGRDILKGTGRRDVIIGLGGRDTVRAAGGGDVVCAGLGADRVLAGAGRDRVRGGGGGDRLLGGAGGDFLFGERGRDVISGGRGRDRCRGGPGRDGAAREAGR